MEIANDIHLEVEILPKCEVLQGDLIQQVKDFVTANVHVFENGPIKIFGPLAQFISRMVVVDLPIGSSISFWAATLSIHIYRLSDAAPKVDFIDQEGSGDLPAYREWELPNEAFAGMWESIIVDENIKKSLLNYCTTSTRFSLANVDDKIIQWQRMLLLNGPPGTGKTTMCKALAQKVFIRNYHNYDYGSLLDINAHSLFSKWFSESGKLVQALFQRIEDIAADTGTFIIVLIDEVESIAASRSAALASGDPGDAIRVVNSVLNCLDTLRHRPNVLVLCTSNMTSSVDAAFRDRLDLTLFMGNPSLAARYSILASCLIELMEKGILLKNHSLQVLPSTLSDAVAEESKEYLRHRDGATDLGSKEMTAEFCLALVALSCEGYSGRRLRKLPLIAHAYHTTGVADLTTFITALTATVMDLDKDAKNVIIEM